MSDVEQSEKDYLDDIQAAWAAEHRERRYRVDFMWEHTYGIIIRDARYGGAYEDCQWYALRCEIEWLDDDQGCDIDCPAWWSAYWDAPIGRGASPGEAYDDLVRVLTIGRETHSKEREVRMRALAVERGEVNVCEHGDHPAPDGKRFCSPECERCEHAEHFHDGECANICGRTRSTG